MSNKMILLLIWKKELKADFLDTQLRGECLNLSA